MDNYWQRKILLDTIEQLQCVHYGDFELSYFLWCYFYHFCASRLWIICTYRVLITWAYYYSVVFFNAFFFLSRHRIQNLTSDKNLKKLSRRTTVLNRSHDFHYKHLISCIKIHKLALKYVKILYFILKGSKFF